jgi:hypothetical protein
MSPSSTYYINLSPTVPPASGTPLSKESQADPGLPSFFVDISAEDTKIVEQSSGMISALRLTGGYHVPFHHMLNRD